MPGINIGVIARNVEISGASMDEVEQMLLKLGLDSSGVTTVTNIAPQTAPAEEAPKKKRSTRAAKKDEEEEAPKKKRSTRAPKKAEPEPEPEEEEGEEPPKKSRAARGRKASDAVEDEVPTRSTRAAKKVEPEPEPEEDDDGEGPDDAALIKKFNGAKFKRLVNVVEYLIDELGWGGEDVTEFCLECKDDIPALASQRNLDKRLAAMIEAKL